MSDADLSVAHAKGKQSNADFFRSHTAQIDDGLRRYHESGVARAGMREPRRQPDVSRSQSRRQKERSQVYLIVHHQTR